jgi:adenylate kinase family enzyme
VEGRGLAAFHTFGAAGGGQRKPVQRIETYGIPQLHGRYALRAVVQASKKSAKRAKAVMDAGKLVSDDRHATAPSESISRIVPRDLFSTVFPYPGRCDRIDSFGKELTAPGIELRVDDEVPVDRVVPWTIYLRCKLWRRLHVTIPKPSFSNEGVCETNAGRRTKRRADDNWKRCGHGSSPTTHTPPPIGYLPRWRQLKTVDGRTTR